MYPPLAGENSVEGRPLGARYALKGRCVAKVQMWSEVETRSDQMMQGGDDVGRRTP